MFKDGTREEGKYKNNILITSNKKKHLFLIRSAKFRERIDSAVNAAQRASKIALQKADIAISRTATARGKAEQADYAAVCARDDSTEARGCAQNFDPNFHQPDGEAAGQGMFLQHEAETKLDLRVGGSGLQAGKLGAGHQAGPGPPQVQQVQPIPDKPVIANHVGPTSGPSVIKQPPAASVPKPSLDVRQPPSVPQGPSPIPPAPSKPQPPRPPASSDPRQNTVSDNSVSSPSVNNKPAPPPPVSPAVPAPLISAPAPRNDMTMPSVPDPTVLRQPATLAPSDAGMMASRGRTPTRQERSRATAQSNEVAAAGSAAGGYNFQKIMDDRFEHYKRPPSRERSTDRFGLGSRQGSRQQLSRDPSRDRVGPPRPASRQRTPMENSFSDNKPDTGLDSLNLDGGPAHGPTGNGSATGAGAGGSFSPDFKLPAEDQIRFRGVQQEIPHFGAPPKRTESLYMKAGDNQQATFKVPGTSAMQRKKSLPDVAALPTVTVKQGSQAMTREEISVLSSARREEIRRQLDEAERYRANPILYIFNPHIREWFSRQQLMMVVLFVNVTLAIMFFKLLT